MTLNQLDLFGGRAEVESKGVGIQVRSASDLSSREWNLLAAAQIADAAPVEAWKVVGTNKQLSYSTHGIFRFFGKFPPPLARHLITEFTQPGDWVLDPMTGSGTTAVESLLLRRNAVVRDISPLSTMLCRVKTTHVNAQDSLSALTRIRERRLRVRPEELLAPVGLRKVDHWFLRETMTSLAEIRAAIEPEQNPAMRDLLLTAFASTVRRVSKATTQQGRLFLDAKKAKADAWPTFSSLFESYAEAVAALPPDRNGSTIQIEELDVKTGANPAPVVKLAIAHPPYFNNYKYSSINSLELAWLGTPPSEIRRKEIREAFKVGNPDKVVEYVADLLAALSAVEQQLPTGGVLALMLGDTIIRNTYVQVARRIIDGLAMRGSRLTLKRVILRVPQYTEASWVASQRRTGDRVGVNLYDFVLLLEKRAGE